MARLIWDAVGEKFYEMGTKMGGLEWPDRCDREPLRR